MSKNRSYKGPSGTVYNERDFINNPEMMKRFEQGYKKYGTSTPADATDAPRIKQTNYAENSFMPYSANSPTGANIGTVLQDALHLAGGDIINHVMDVDRPNAGGYNTGLAEGLAGTGLALATAAVPAVGAARAARSIPANSKLATSFAKKPFTRNELIDLQNKMRSGTSSAEFKKYHTLGIANKPYDAVPTTGRKQIPYRDVTTTTPERFVLDSRTASGVNAGADAESNVFSFNPEKQTFEPILQTQRAGKNTRQSNVERYKRIPEETITTTERIAGEPAYGDETDKVLLKLFKDTSADAEAIRSARTPKELHNTVNRLKYNLSEDGKALLNQYEDAMRTLFVKENPAVGTAYEVADKQFGARKDLIKQLAQGINDEAEKAAVPSKMTLKNELLRPKEPTVGDMLDLEIQPRNYRLRQDMAAGAAIPTVRPLATPLLHGNANEDTQPIGLVPLRPGFNTGRPSNDPALEEIRTKRIPAK